MNVDEYNRLPELLSLKEFKTIAGLDKRTVNKCVEAGKVRFFQLEGGRRHYHKTSLISGLGVQLTK